MQLNTHFNTSQENGIFAAALSSRIINFGKLWNLAFKAVNKDTSNYE